MTLLFIFLIIPQYVSVYIKVPLDKTFYIFIHYLVAPCLAQPAPSVLCTYGLINAALLYLPSGLC